MMKVAWGICLSSKVKSARLIINDAGRRKNRKAAFHSAGDGSRINKWLEDGAGLAHGNSVVQLAGAVIASSHQRLDLAGSRVERNQSDLRLARRDVFASAELAIHIGH